MSRTNSAKLVDVPIVKLTPLRTRTIPPKAYAKLLANIKAVGLIEPLCVYRDGEQYQILDGYLRYQALMELGVEVVPCLQLSTKDLYTPNRQVNSLSTKDQNKMLRKALEKIDEKTLSAALGMQSLGTRLSAALERSLQPQVALAMEAGKLSRAAAKEMAYVVPRRQAEILHMMKETGDWSMPFVKAQILKTSPQLRSQKKRRETPWDKSTGKKRALVKKLEEVEKHFDFYSGLYRQYVGDLLKLSAYIRQILNRPKLRAHLAEKHPEAMRMFAAMIQESEGKAVSEA